MFPDLHIHSPSHLVKSVIGNLETLFTGLKYPANELIVLNYHSTPKKFINDFEKQVVYLKSRFNIISPAELQAFYSANGHQSNRCSLLFTFDDGLKNNSYAIEVLEKHGISAFLFIVPDFVNSRDQKHYYLSNIRPVINPGIDSEPEDFTALSWTELKDMIIRGHSIGSHTLTHTLVAGKSDQANSEKEIVGSKRELEKELSVTIDAFCSINNTLESVALKEKKLITGNYRYHFTTLPGSNAGKDALFIKRRNVECYWRMGAVKFAIGKFDLARWAGNTAYYEKL